MLVPSTSKNMTTLISSHLLRSLWVSSSSLFSLWCRRLCRAVGVTLGDGGQGVSRRSSGLEFSTGFDPKRCCSTTEWIVLSRKLRGQNQRHVGLYSKLWKQSTFSFVIAENETLPSIIWGRVQLTWMHLERGGQGTEGYWRKNKRAGGEWLWQKTGGCHRSLSNTPSSSTSCSGRSGSVCMSEQYPLRELLSSVLTQWLYHGFLSVAFIPLLW